MQHENDGLRARDLHKNFTLVKDHARGAHLPLQTLVHNRNEHERGGFVCGRREQSEKDEPYGRCLVMW